MRLCSSERLRQRERWEIDPWENQDRICQQRSGQIWLYSQTWNYTSVDPKQFTVSKFRLKPVILIPECVCSRCGHTNQHPPPTWRETTGDNGRQDHFRDQEADHSCIKNPNSKLFGEKNIHQWDTPRCWYGFIQVVFFFSNIPRCVVPSHRGFFHQGAGCLDQFLTDLIAKSTQRGHHLSQDFHLSPGRTEARRVPLFGPPKVEHVVDGLVSTTTWVV